MGLAPHLHCSICFEHAITVLCREHIPVTSRENAGKIKIRSSFMQRTRKGDEESVWEAVVALSRSRPCGPPLLGKRFSLRPIVAHGELWWEQRSALTPYPNGCGVGRRFCPHPLSPSPARRGGTRTRQRLWLPSLVGGWCASRQARSVRPARAAPAARRAGLGERAALSSGVHATTTHSDVASGGDG
jgi:hypothetical protein